MQCATIVTIKYVMITLNKYIEHIFEEKQTSTSNKERREQLEKWLKNKKYSDYVKTLNKMLKDPKAKTLLADGFGGDIGDIEFVFQPRLIRAASLMPTQSEIDIEQSLKHTLTKPELIKKNFTDSIVINDAPIVTFRGNYVIDGHHRWAETAMINPDGKMLCFDYDADISPIQMLKAVQGAIAAALANNDGKDSLPQSKTKAQNIYDDRWGAKKITKWIDKTMTDDSANEFTRFFPKCHEKDDIVKILTDNVVNFKINNRPIEYAPKRSDMPQPTKAGKVPGDKSTAKPDTKGSALNRLKDGSFLSDTL